MSKEFNLIIVDDDNLVCHSIIAFGYPKDNEFAYRDQFDQTCVEYR